MKKKMILLSLLPLVLSGCAVVKIYDESRQAGFKAVTPAWPWQDSTRILDKMNVSSRSNTFTASLRGLSESETTSTNVTAVAGEILGTAIRTAITPR